VKRRADGTFEVALDQQSREVLIELLTQLGEQLEAAPDDPSLRRLSPTAYPDDADADAAYQLLAGEELRSSRQAAIDVVVRSLGQDTVTEDELWSWLQALNSVRLVVGTSLDITDDDHRPDPRRTLSAQEASWWAVYDFTTLLQYEIIQGLGS
jgi:hypothetical protein